MVKFRYLPEDKFKDVLTIEEHAELVLELLKEQRYETSVESDDLCPVKNQVLLMKLRDIICDKQLKRTDPSYTPISNGAHISTRSRLVSPMGRKKVSKRVRKEMNGNVIKESEYFPGFWLVHFFSEEVNEFYYCRTKTLKFISSSAVTSQIAGDNFDNTIASVPLKVPPHDNEEAIMLCLLNDKIHQADGYKDISVKDIVTLFTPKFLWMTMSKLQSFIQRFRKDMKKKKSGSQKKPSPKKGIDNESTPALKDNESPYIPNDGKSFKDDSTSASKFPNNYTFSCTLYL